MKRSLSVLGISTICFLTLAFASPVQAQSFVKEINYTLEQPFGNTSVVTSFGQYLQMVYSYSAGIIGIIAVVLIMAGGIMWIGAAGNEQIIGTAKEIIISALTAVVIIVLSYAILIFISPRLVEISFSLQKIPIVDVEDFYKLPKCTNAPYTGKNCINESALEVSCDTIPCGEVGQLEGTGNCRGGATSCAAGFGCYRDAANPTETMSCQIMACGQMVDTCADNYEADSGDYAACLCAHNTRMMQYFGGGSILYGNYSSTDQRTIYKEICAGTTSNTDWVTKVGKTPYSTYYRGTSASQAATIGLNCGISSMCSIQKVKIGSDCVDYCGGVTNLPGC